MLHFFHPRGFESLCSNVSKAGSSFFCFFATEEEDGEFFRFGFCTTGFVLSPKSEPRLSLNVSKRCFPGCQLDGYLMLYFSSGHDCRGAKVGLRDDGSEVNVLGPVAFVVAHVFGLDKFTQHEDDLLLFCCCCSSSLVVMAPPLGGGDVAHTIFPIFFLLSSREP